MGKIALTSVALLLLGGCQALPSKPSFNSDLVLPATSPGGPVAGSMKPSPGPPTSCSPTPTTLQARNDCIRDFMTIIDDAYYQYAIKVNNRISGTNAALAVAQSAFSISGTASTGTAAKVLNSLGTFTGDVKTTISDELLYKTAIQIVLSTMEADRAKLAAQITLHMQQQLADYPLSQAKNDLVAYFYAGTVTQALADANNNAGAVAQKCTSANTAVKSAVAQGNAPQVAAAATASSSGGAGTTSDQCNQIADALTFKADTTTTATTLLTLLAPNGVYSKDADAVLNACVKTTTSPQGFNLSNYTLPDGSYDLGSLIADNGVDAKYKAQLLTCGQAGVAKKQAANVTPPALTPPAAGAQPAAKKKG